MTPEQLIDTLSPFEIRKALKRIVATYDEERDHPAILSQSIAAILAAYWLRKEDEPTRMAIHAEIESTLAVSRTDADATLVPRLPANPQPR